jgi:hypothetical protein
MIQRRVRNYLKPVVLMLCAAAFTLSLSSAIVAKSRRDAKVNAMVANSKSVVSAKDVKRNLLRMISRKAKNSSGQTGCRWAVVMQEVVGPGSRFRNCLQDWGISYGSLITCGGVCGLAATGNPIGIGVCAACLGTAEWIVAGCALEAIMNRWAMFDGRLSRPPRLRGLHQAKISFLRPTPDHRVKATV